MTRNVGVTPMKSLQSHLQIAIGCLLCRESVRHREEHQGERATPSGSGGGLGYAGKHFRSTQEDYFFSEGVGKAAPKSGSWAEHQRLGGAFIGGGKGAGVKCESMEVFIELILCAWQSRKFFTCINASNPHL